jgi:hypothetical protein
MNDYSQEWVDLFNSESQFYSKRMKYFSNNEDVIINDFKKGLTDDYFVEFAIRSVENHNVKIKQELIQELLEIALDGKDICVKPAREMLLEIDKGIIKHKIQPYITSYLMKEIDSESRYYLYLNIAQLYYELKFDNELKLFINQYCRFSPDKGIKEIYEDFSNE